MMALPYCPKKCYDVCIQLERSCEGGRQNMPPPLEVDLLTLRVVSESRVTWTTSVQIVFFLGLSVLDLGPMYMTDGRQTDRRQMRSSLNVPTLVAGHNNTVVEYLYWTGGQTNGHREMIEQCHAVYVCACSLCLHFNGHFPGGPGLAGARMSPFWILLELRMMEAVLTTGAVRRAQLQSNRHYQQTNTKLYTG